MTEGLPIGTYNIIYADPPWRYEQRKVQGAAENHYPTMSIDELCALPVPELAAKDCALFLWATFPQLPEALRLIRAWGFRYKTVAFVWLKRNRKSPSWFYGIAEPIAPTTALRKKAGRGVGKYSAPVPGQPQTQNINKPREKGSITDDMISPVRAKRDVWFINTVPYKGGHFAAYPPLLAETCILAGCPKGGIVLDPFMGSGTTGLAAKRHGRHYIGIELNTEFCSLARERIGGDTH